MRGGRRHTWMTRYRWLLTGAVFVMWVLGLASQHAHESSASFETQMTHVAAVATIAWLPLCFPRFTLRLLNMTLALSLLGAGVTASRPGRR